MCSQLSDFFQFSAKTSEMDQKMLLNFVGQETENEHRLNELSVNFLSVKKNHNWTATPKLSRK